MLKLSLRKDYVGGGKLSSLILFVLLAMLPNSSWADTWKDSYGNTWEYEVANQEATIYGYQNDGSYQENLVIPEELDGCPVTVIDAATFSQSFSSVIIPGTVRKIGNKAFQYSVEKVICKGETPAELGRTVFYNNGKDFADNFLIYVPKSAVASYKTAWSAYASYVKESPAGTTFNDNGHKFRINDDCNTITLVKAGSNYYLDLQYRPYYLGNHYTVSAIGESALAGYTTIDNNSVLITGNITSIGNEAFANSNVSEIFIESQTPAEIGTNVFSGVSNLKIYVEEDCLSDYQEKWNDYADYIVKYPVGETFTVGDYEYTLTTYNWYNQEAQISKYTGKESVIDFSNLISKYNGHSITIYQIGANAFKDNTYITKVILPDNIKEIGSAAFQNCSNLSTFIYSNNAVHSLPSDNVFSGCADNLVIYVPEKLVDQFKSTDGWSNYANHIQASKAGTRFTIDNLEYAINNDMNTVSVVNYSGSETDVVIPSSVNYEEASYNVTKIGDDGYQALANNAMIESITVPASVTSVSTGAIQNLENLRSVYFLSKSPVTIDYANFWGCGDKYKLYVPKGTVEAYTEANKTTDNQYTFKEDLRGTDYQDGNLVYHINQDLTLTLKEYKGTGDEMVTIAKEVRVDGETLTVTSIADKVFADKDFIKTFVVMGDALTRLEGQDAFVNCASDMVIYVLPSMVDTYKTAENWSAYADYIQGSLAGKEFTSGDYTFVLNEDLQSVGVSSYKNNNSEEVTIPSEFTDSETGKTYPVTTIKSNAFSSSYKVKSFIIAASVTLIEEDGFQGCDNLNTVQLLGNATSVKKNAFGDNFNWDNRYILVSEEAYDYYRNTFDGSWSNYHNKVAVLGESRVLTDDDALPTKRYLYKSGTLTYRRTVDKAGQYATLCLPFEYNLSEAKGVEVAYSMWDTMIHYLNSTANNNEGVEKFILMLTKREGYVDQGGQMIVKLANDNNVISVTNKSNVVLVPDMKVNWYTMSVLDWDGTSGIMEENRNYAFRKIGTYTKIDASQITATAYTFNPDGTFGPQTSGYIKPFRAYLTCENSFSSYARYNISIGVKDGETTGIRELTTTPARKNTNAVYDINGRLVNMTGSTEGLSKGVYIIGGKKVIISK